MKSKEELNKIKEDVEAVNEKLQELTPEEIAQVNGGASYEGTTGKYTIRCSNPSCFMNQNVSPTVWDPNDSSCPLCGGTLSIDFVPYAK